MSDVGDAKPRFEEVQQFRQWWLVLLLVVILAATLGVFGWGIFQQLVRGKPFGSKPISDSGLIALAAVVVPFGLGLTGMIWFMRLVIRVEADGLFFRFAPFVRGRRIPWSQIKGFRAVTYRPIAEYGGWGVRGFASNRAYNVRGDRGLRLRLEDGKLLLLGSQRATELEGAVAAASGREPGGVD